jgi:integrase
MSIRQDTLSTEQLRQLLSVLREIPELQDLYDVVTIVSNTGIRTGELRNLRWTDVDFQKCQLRIDCLHSRQVPFGPKTRQILEVRREREPQSTYVLGESPSAIQARVSNQLRMVCDGFAESRVTLLLLRRTFFERMIYFGCDPHSLMKIGGYRSPYSAMKCLLDGNQLIEIAIRYLSQIEQY